MKGHKTTFVGLFDEPDAGQSAITSIEIPMIQRDFTQGRPDEAIRERFLDAMVRAATTDSEMPLDDATPHAFGSHWTSWKDAGRTATTLRLAPPSRVEPRG